MESKKDIASSDTKSLPWWRLVILLFAIGLTALIFIYREQVARFSTYGYLGLFFVSVIGNATVLLPVPSLAATFVTGGVFNPLIVGIVSGAGMAIGELSGYLAGYGGGAIIESQDRVRYERMENWMRRYGLVTIFVLAGIAAGALHFPLWQFLLICFLGKTVKGIALACAGAQSMQWLERLLH